MGLIKGCYQVILFIITFGPATYCQVLTFAHIFLEIDIPVNINMNNL